MSNNKGLSKKHVKKLKELERKHSTKKQTEELTKLLLIITTAQ